MRHFRKFFLLSLGFFLFLFFAKFLVLAFIAATLLTFISSIVKGVKQSTYYGDYRTPYSRQGLPYAGAPDFDTSSGLVEPLLGKEYAENSWRGDHRSINVF